MKKYTHSEMTGGRLRLTLSLCVGVVFAFAGVMLMLQAVSRNWLAVLAGLALIVLSVLAFVLAAGLVAADNVGVSFTVSVRRKWSRACVLLGLSVMHDGRRQVPLLRRLQGNTDEWQAVIGLWPGQRKEDIEKRIDDLMAILGVRVLSVEWATGGDLLLKASRLLHAEPVESEIVTLVPVAPAPVTGIRGLQVINVGVSADRGAYSLPVLYSHLLLVGISGAGKSSWIWSLIFGLAGGIQEGLVDLWAVDPKGLELAIAPEWWNEYASEDAAMVALLERAIEEIKRRGALMAGKTRKVTPSKDMPLIVIFIDELADIMVMPDKKLRERAINAVTRILRQGRALAVTLVGASQTPSKDTLSMRDDFPVRICLAVGSSQVDMVLGQGAKESGARPDKLVLPYDAGSAYVWNAAVGEYVLVRSHFVEDDVIQQAGKVVRGYEAGRDGGLDDAGHWSAAV